MDTKNLFHLKDKKNNEEIILNKVEFKKYLGNLLKMKDLNLIKKEIVKLKFNLIYKSKEITSLLTIDNNNEKVELKEKYLVEELEKIEKSKTLERAKYYLEKLIKSITEIRTGKINDINLNRWKEYDEILTDSLWIFDKRDNSGSHVGWYWGNFIPQIPRQFILRYTKKGDWVLDTFLGSGTTLIECKRLGRNGIGIELNPSVAEKAKELINRETNNFNVITDVIVGDSSKLNFKDILKNKNIEKVQLIVMHPPYHDIIKFSENPDDLSNSKSVEEFLNRLRKVVENTYDILEKGRYLVLVIGDKYSKGEWIPLGFYAMNEIMHVGYRLKSIIVKNFEETRGKKNQKELWRYRALVGGFYVFKHEYIFLFQKK